jgi:hypothetical protein
VITLIVFLMIVYVASQWQKEAETRPPTAQEHKRERLRALNEQRPAERAARRRERERQKSAATDIWIEQWKARFEAERAERDRRCEAKQAARAMQVSGFGGGSEARYGERGAG